jgi:WD40-like Beta Propeller Repeat
MKTFWTRALLVLIPLLLVSCIQYPVDFGDPSVLRGNFIGTVSSECYVRVYLSAWSPDGKKIATIDDRTGGRLTIWDNQTGAELSFIDKLELPYGAGYLNWTADGNHVSYNDTVQPTARLRFYNVEMKSLEPDVLLENGQKYWSTKISASGNRILGYYEDRIEGAINPFGANFRIWDSFTGKVLFTKHFDLNVYPSFAFNSDGQEFAIWFDGTLQTWSVASGQKTHEWKLPGDRLDALTYSNNDQSLNALVQTGNYPSFVSQQFVRFDKNSLEGVWQTKGSNFGLYHFSPDGQFASLIDYSTPTSQHKLLNLGTGVFSQIQIGSDYWYPGLFSPDGQSILYGSTQACNMKRIGINDGQTRILTLETLEIKPISLQLSATWQDKKQYSITGTATLNNQSGLIVTGTGYAADNEYFINPRTPAIRPRRAEITLKDASGTLVGFGMLWNGTFDGVEPNTFSGQFQSSSVSMPYNKLVFKRQP